MRSWTISSNVFAQFDFSIAIILKASVFERLSVGIPGMIVSMILC